MIKSFQDKETEKVYRQKFSRSLASDVQRIALRKLMQLDNAASLDDLRQPPSNRLEALHGDREGQHNIRINDQWRLCFIWDIATSHAFKVEITDYH